MDGGSAGSAVQGPQVLASHTAATETADQKQGPGKKREGEQWPWEILCERKLVLGKAPRPLRAIMLVVFVQLGLVVLLLLTQHLPQPMVDSGVLDTLGGRYVAPLPLFLVLNLSLAAGYWFTLAGALRMRWLLGLPVVLAVIYVLAFVPLSKILNGGGNWAYEGQLGILTLLGIWELGAMARQWFTSSRQTGQQGRPAHPTASGSAGDAEKSHLLQGGSFIGVLVLLLGYYGLELALWLTTALSHQVGAGNSVLLTDLGTQTVTLTTLLIVVLLLGSTDILEWGEMAVASGMRVLKFTGSNWFLWIILFMAALATIVKVWNAEGSGVWLGLLVAGVLALAVWGLLRLVTLPGGWSDSLRTPAVQIGAVLVYCYLILISHVTDTVGIKWGLLQSYFAPLFVLFALPIGLAALAISLFVLLNRSPKQPVLWLFAALVLVLLVISSVPGFLSASHLPAYFPLQHFQSGVQLLAGSGALVWSISLLVRKQVRTATEQLTSVLLLLAGLQMVFWVQALLDWIAALQGSSTFWLALLFLATSAWGLATAGEQLQLNGQSSTDEQSQPKDPLSTGPVFYPREGRVLLYAGYTLISTVLLLYLGSLQVAAAGANQSADFSDVYSKPALSVLGTLIAVLAFLMRMQKSPAMQKQAPEPQAQPARGGPARTLSWSVLGGGALLATLLLGYVLLGALPQLRQHNNKDLTSGYSAVVPGPNCDGGGATWSLTPNDGASTSCQKTALQVTDRSQIPADLEFLPPNGQFSQNYKVTVQVDLHQIANGCTALLTRFSSAGYYQSKLCTNGLWVISKITPASTTVLESGLIPRTSVATLGATSLGANQLLTLNGSAVGTVSDQALAQGSVWLQLQNVASTPASALFSNFYYEPLPAVPEFTTINAYRTFIPGPNCDRSGAQWALATPSSSALRCLPSGLQINAHRLGVVEFTLPGGIFPANYQVSLTADMRGLPVGCVGIITRATGADFYWSRVCQNGLLATWSITREQDDKPVELKQGVTDLASVYTLTATANGAQQSFAINGKQVAIAPDGTYQQTAYLGLEVLNLLPGQASALVNNLRLTPLA